MKTNIKKAVFLDRDGTINVEKNYLYKIEDFEFLPGVFSALRLLQDADYLLIIMTNQSGIARGYYSEEQFLTLNSWMLNVFEREGIMINKVYYCPHHPDSMIEKYKKNCDCRKPKLGMFKQAIDEFGISIDKSFAIGDKIRDCSICESTPCRGYLIGENENLEIIEKVKNGMYTRIRYARTLYKASKIIVSENNGDRIK